MNRKGHLFLACTALALATHGLACGGGAAHPSGSGVEALRRRAADAPTDPALQRRLALAEVFMPGGDMQRAGPQTDRALVLAPQDVRLLYVAALVDDVHGHPTDALGHYLDTLDAAASSTDPLAPFIASSAAAAIRDLEDVARAYVATVGQRLPARLAEPGRIGDGARHLLGNALIELAYRRGDMEQVHALATATGCITEWRVAGPFGPRALLGFDRSFPPEGPGPLAERYDLGPGRGQRATRTIEARGCRANVGGGPAAGAGTTYAEAFVDITEGGDHVIRLETPNATEMFVDGRTVIRLDRRQESTPRVSYHHVTLERGRRELTIKITSRHPNPVLAVTVRRAAEGAPHMATFPAEDSLFATYVRAETAMVRGHPVTAREALRALDNPDDAAAPFLLARAGVALADPMLPSSERRDEARRLLRLVRQRDPKAWYAASRLATLDAADGRVVQAIEALRVATATWPDLVHLHLTLSDLLIGRGWTAQADRAVERARQVAPDACRPVRAALQAARRRDIMDEDARLTEALLRCDARSDARFRLFVRRRDWDGARRELARLRALAPRQSEIGNLLATLGVARAAGDERAVERALTRLADVNPRSDSVPIARVDRLLARGQRNAADRLLSAAIDREPAALGGLRVLRLAMGTEFELTPFRLDGARVIREFEASGREYDQPQLLVLDYTVVRVFRDGSTMSLTHNIWRLQSDEAVDEHGEFHLADGARLLTLRTIKAAGRRIEPDEITGKETISLPNLAVGDYVEYEFVTTDAPARGFPGGYLGDRFYFQSFETPFDRSELTMILPRSMQVAIDPRGPAPRVRRRNRGDLQVLTWRVQESRPLVPEPASVASREFIPSINIGVEASWESLIENLLDMLADRDRRSPAAVRLTRSITDGASDDEARARLLYAWVLNNVEDNDDVFGLAPAMLAGRTGDRTRILRYMLGIAGIDAKLVLVRSVGADVTPSDVADDDTYKHLLVMLGDGDARHFLSTVQRGAPFGYLPPALRGQEGLVLAPGPARVTIPEPPEGVDRHTIAIEVTLGDAGEALVRVTETMRGAGAVSWRGELEQIAAAVLDQRFEESYLARLVPGAALRRLEITGQGEPQEPLVFEYAFNVPSLGRQQQGRRLIPALFPNRMAAAYAGIAQRHTTELIGAPLDLRVTMSVRPPQGAPPPEPPGDIELQGPHGATFRMTSSVDGPVLTVERATFLPIMRVTPTEYASFAGFCRAADEAEQREVRVATTGR